jgi:hypothetical protein
MRTFQTLTTTSMDADSGILVIDAHEAVGLHPQLMLRREGEYVAISAAYGPIEIALRLRYQELTRALRTLQPVDGLQTARQVGSGQVFIGMGLQLDGRLLLRPTLVGDASGYAAFNLALANDAREALFRWLGI